MTARENAFIDSGTSPPVEQIEHWVDATRASEFLDIDRKFLLKLARLRKIPATPMGIGSRRQWKFKLSKLDEWMQAQSRYQDVPEHKNVPPKKAPPKVPLAESAAQPENGFGNARVKGENK